MTSSSARDEAEETQGPPWIFFLNFILFSQSPLFSPLQERIYFLLFLLLLFSQMTTANNRFLIYPFLSVSAFHIKRRRRRSLAKAIFPLYLLIDELVGWVQWNAKFLEGGFFGETKRRAEKGQAVPSCLLSRGRKVSSARQHRNDDSDSRVGGKNKLYRAGSRYKIVIMSFLRPLIWRRLGVALPSMASQAWGQASKKRRSSNNTSNLAYQSWFLLSRAWHFFPFCHLRMPPADSLAPESCPLGPPSFQILHTAALERVSEGSSQFLAWIHMSWRGILLQGK